MAREVHHGPESATNTGEDAAVPVIHFLDVTNRDGVQTARTGLSKFGKTMVNV